MNRQIVKLFGLILLAFGVLVGFTSYWSVFDAHDLKQKRVNKRPLFEAQQIKRGRIVSSDGVLLAKSVGKGRGTQRRYVRRYPQGSLYGHPIGYSFADKGDSEFEEYHNDELVGNDSEFNSILDELRGRKQQGNDIVSTIDSSAQQVAIDQLAGRSGAVVAIAPQTGKVRVMAAEPQYDPNTVPTQLNALNKDPDAPLLDRSTQGQYQPGSTFKVVTAAAALDSGKFSPTETIDSPGSIMAQGHELSNDFDQDFGPIDMRTALTHSVNTFFGQLGQRVGTDTLYEYMDRFGFNSKPRIDLPSDQLSTSGVFDSDGNLLGPDDPVDLARLAIGQERLLVTPLQMAEVAAAIANQGKLMKPSLWERVRDPDGRVTKRMNPTVQSDVVSPKTAAELTDMMSSVVEEGTGTAAALSGVSVAGKTGTAEIPGRAACEGLPNTAWFIGFAPADDPKIAVAATIACTSSQGGLVAAPIVAAVMQDILGG